MKWMPALLTILSLLVLVWSYTIFDGAKGGIHEVYGAVMALISAILFVGAMIIESINRVAMKLDSANPKKFETVEKHSKPIKGVGSPKSSGGRDAWIQS